MGSRIKEIPKTAVKYLKNTWRILLRPSSEMELNELVRRRTYGMFSILLCLVVLICILLFVFLHIPEILVFAGVLIVIYLGYVLMTEHRFASGKVVEHIAKCTGKKILRNKKEDPLCSYQFEGTGNSEGLTFFITKTEKLGFTENATYYLCFYDDGMGTFRGENLIGSIQIQ